MLSRETINPIITELELIQEAVKDEKLLLLEEVVQHNHRAVELHSMLTQLKSDAIHVVIEDKDEKKEMDSQMIKAALLSRSLADKTYSLNENYGSIDKVGFKTKMGKSEIRSNNEFPLNEDVLLHVFKYLTVTQQAKIACLSTAFANAVREAAVCQSVIALGPGCNMLIMPLPAGKLTHRQVRDTLAKSLVERKDALSRNHDAFIKKQKDQYREGYLKAKKYDGVLIVLTLLLSFATDHKTPLFIIGLIVFMHLISTVHEEKTSIPLLSNRLKKQVSEVTDSLAINTRRLGC